MRCAGCGKLCLDWIAIGRVGYCPDCIRAMAQWSREEGDLDYAERLEAKLWVTK